MKLSLVEFPTFVVLFLIVILLTDPVSGKYTLKCSLKCLTFFNDLLMLRVVGSTATQKKTKA